MNFETPNLDKKSGNGPREVFIENNWENPELPKKEKADAWKVVFKGFSEPEGKNGPKSDF